MKLLIAGGGTGGHIYPAISVAQAFLKKYPDGDVHFVGTQKGLEKKIIPKEGYPISYISIGGLNQVGLVKKITTLALLPWSFIQSFMILIRQKPSFVLGVGGYSSGPVLLCAWILGIKIYLFEPNAQPGMTNRILSQLATKAFLNFSSATKFFPRSDVVGIPIRKGLTPQGREPSALLRVLIFGGSQGARAVNNVVMESVAQGGPWQGKVEIVHQTGSLDFQKVKNFYNKYTPHFVSVHEFLFDMPKYYSWADIVICRAGASSIAELAAMHKAAILVPFPGATDNHQFKNAEALSLRGAAVLVEQKDLSVSKLISLFENYAANPSQIESLETEVAKFYRPQTAEAIVDAMSGGKS